VRELLAAPCPRRLDLSSAAGCSPGALIPADRLYGSHGEQGNVRSAPHGFEKLVGQSSIRGRMLKLAATVQFARGSATIRNQYRSRYDFPLSDKPVSRALSTVTWDNPKLSRRLQQLPAAAVPRCLQQLRDSTSAVLMSLKGRITRPGPSKTLTRSAKPTSDLTWPRDTRVATQPLGRSRGKLPSPFR